MTVEERVGENKDERKSVLVGIKINGNSRELLNWALAKVAEPGDRVVALHVCQYSDLDKENSSAILSTLDDYLAVYEGFCSVKKINLVGQISQGNSIRKVLVREMKLCHATALIVGIRKSNALGCPLSLARYCAKRLPATTSVLAIHKGKIVFQKNSTKRLSGLTGDPRPSICSSLDLTLGDDSKVLNPSHKEIPNIGLSRVAQVENLAPQTDQDSNDSGQDLKQVTLELDSPPTEKDDIMKTDDTETGSLSSSASKSSIDLESVEEIEDGNYHHAREQIDEVSSSISLLIRKLPDSTPGWPLLRKAVSANPEVFKGTEARKISVVQWVMRLPNRSSSFSSQLQIGLEPYRGEYHESGGEKSARSSLSAWFELPRELEMLFSTNSTKCRVFSHKEVQSSMTQFSPGKGHKTVLPWDVRFKVAVGVAEALTFLHSSCSRPIIHRDVKSSNILLSNEFEPQLSDFGLALWAPTSSACVTYSDVVGTFGYLAPEYFMYGKVSVKIDVYSFGVVLLELLSGRKPIDTENPKGQESLVMWATPKLETGYATELLDPKLGREYDENQMRQMVLAATLCVTKTAQHRPEMSQILKLLLGVEDVVEWAKSEVNVPKETDLQDEEAYPVRGFPSHHIDLTLLEADDDATSLSSIEQNHHHSLEDYLRGRLSGSSIFD
ncbi:hypothetical protein MRB53_033277 [Persea americana]|uniref:Uncharacterized protein n=1 Tax=Persea americana TaxID=3435 RepID=A0ACC2KU79_PERAE|nr:hypothetical protein MRB53_033277 [Persea americana]